MNTLCGDCKELETDIITPSLIMWNGIGIASI